MIHSLEETSSLLRESSFSWIVERVPTRADLSQDQASPNNLHSLPGISSKLLLLTKRTMRKGKSRSVTLKTTCCSLTLRKTNSKMSLIRSQKTPRPLPRSGEERILRGNFRFSIRTLPRSRLSLGSLTPYTDSNLALSYAIERI